MLSEIKSKCLIDLGFIHTYSCHLGTLGLVTELVEIHCSDSHRFSRHLRQMDSAAFPGVMEVYTG